jgi:hypothetical protein
MVVAVVIVVVVVGGVVVDLLGQCEQCRGSWSDDDAEKCSQRGKREECQPKKIR